MEIAGTLPSKGRGNIVAMTLFLRGEGTIILLPVLFRQRERE